MFAIGPCKFSKTLVRDYNWRKDAFEWVEKELKIRPVKKIPSNNCVRINGVEIPSLTAVRVFINGEDKVVLAGDVVKLIDEGKDVRTLTGEKVTAEKVGDCKVCLFEFEENYPQHDVFVEANGVLFRLQDPESLAGIQIASSFAELVTEALPGILELEFDKAILVHAQRSKKRYAGWKNEDKLLVKGLEIVRRDWGDEAKALLKKAIMLSLHKPAHIAVEEVKEMIEEEIERFESGNFTIDEVILSSGVRDFSEYKTKNGKLPNLPQIRVALQLINAGLIVAPGSKVEYVPFKVPAEDVIAYVNGKLTIQQLRARLPRKKKDIKPLYERVVARELVEDKFEKLKEFVDVDYYLDSQILPPVLRFAETMWPGFKVVKKKRDKKTKSLMSFLKPKRKLGDVEV